MGSRLQKAEIPIGNGALIAFSKGMAAKFTLRSHLPSAEDLLLCAQCRDVTSAIRGLCVKCGHPSVFLLREVIQASIHLPELDDPDSWIVRLLDDLLIGEQRTRTPYPLGLPAI